MKPVTVLITQDDFCHVSCFKKSRLDLHLFGIFRWPRSKSIKVLLTDLTLLICGVRTRTRHRVPPTPRVMYRGSRRRRPVWKRGTQAIWRVLFRTRNPTRPGGTPSGRAAAMGCPRLVRLPLEPRGSQPFNMKNKQRTREKEQGRDVKLG